MTADRRELVIAEELQHQFRDYLKTLGIDVIGVYPMDGWADEFVIHFDATPEQWESINQWVEKVKQ